MKFSEAVQEDGRSFINLSVYGQTDIGQWLSTATNPPDVWCISTPDGVFNTIEGYIQWLRHGFSSFRTMPGEDAIMWWKKPSQVNIVSAYPRIENALEYKIQASPILQAALTTNELPFKCYFKKGQDTVSLEDRYYFYIKKLLEIQTDLQSKEKTA